MKRWYKRIGVISNLPTKHLAGSPQLAQRLGTGGVAQPGRRRTRDNNDVHIRGHAAAVRSIDLPDEPLDAVADNGATHLARYGETHSASPPFPPGHITDEFTADAFTARAVYRFEVLASLEPLLLWKTIETRHNGLIALQLGRQPLAASCPPAPYYIASTRRRHPGAKTVIALAPDV